MNTGDVTVVILAAGESSRLGRPKQLVPVDGTPLLTRAARTALAAGLGPVVVVLGASEADVAPVLAGLDLRTVTNPSWPLGMGTSIAAGIRDAALRPECAAVILMSCDQPGVTADHLCRLAAAWRATAATTVASRYGGAAGIPALFARARFAALAVLAPTAGARSLLGEEPSVPCDACERDVDTPADLPWT